MHAKFHISQFSIFKDLWEKKEILFPAVVYHLIEKIYLNLLKKTNKQTFKFIVLSKKRNKDI